MSVLVHVALRARGYYGRILRSRDAASERMCVLHLEGDCQIAFLGSRVSAPARSACACLLRSRGRPGVSAGLGAPGSALETCCLPAAPGWAWARLPPPMAGRYRIPPPPACLVFLNKTICGLSRLADTFGFSWALPSVQRISLAGFTGSHLGTQAWWPCSVNPGLWFPSEASALGLRGLEPRSPRGDHC